MFDLTSFQLFVDPYISLYIFQYKSLIYLNNQIHVHEASMCDISISRTNGHSTDLADQYRLSGIFMGTAHGFNSG